MLFDSRFCIFAFFIRLGFTVENSLMYIRIETDAALFLQRLSNVSRSNTRKKKKICFFRENKQIKFKVTKNWYCSVLTDPQIIVFVK